jgi:TRAP-type uncharacterized transport system substrate-binding protein
MKPLSIVATALALVAGAALAQSTGDRPAEAQPPAVTLATGNESKHAREADARHCLELKDNNAIIRCAERYRYRAAYRTVGY